MDLDKNILATLNPKSLELILYPTEQCNFRCTYCYEDFLIGRMDEKTQEGIRNLIARRLPKLDNLHLQWFGGEPLAAKDLVLELSEFAKKACDQAGVNFSGSLTTNGYLLTLDLAEKLCDLNQRNYQISLDGFESGHDKTRKLASGAGTFNRIWSNLLALKGSNLDFNVTLRVHLTKENVSSVKRLAEEIKKTFLSDRRFKVFLKTIENLGGPNDTSGVLLSKNERLATLAELNELLNEKTVSKSDNGLYVCYASRPNSLAIRADGTIQKCTVMLSDDRNSVGKINENGTVKLDSERMNLWMRGYSDDKKTLSCPAVGLPKIPNLIPVVNAS
ncbi:radical SAM protein [Pseudomonas sp. 43A]|jgi:uncharacterized protein|uniref:radical SAM protein n=1 Tax=unclassified Pseudomonas TaxID=196821 RepID=UPI000C8410BA|nr:MULTISPECIES: radical SAM protein [unclassified Pseudomonas]PMQ14000.1 hypothetical protein PseAD21_01325 [Pseudomonas sp. AD21]QKV65802.1 radical SAM protein [Pseudomonas sp. 43A]QMW11745.1 radical SAM protein [Pseudomonas sp. 29A]